MKKKGQTENVRRKVTIPAIPEHNGFYKATVEVEWKCPVCGGDRGEIKQVVSYDGSRRMTCDGWENPCGHVDKYSAVIKEALQTKGEIR